MDTKISDIIFYYFKAIRDYFKENGETLWDINYEFSKCKQYYSNDCWFSSTPNDTG